MNFDEIKYAKQIMASASISSLSVVGRKNYKEALFILAKYKIISKKESIKMSASQLFDIIEEYERKEKK